MIEAKTGVEITAEELAEAFVGACSDEQAEFLNAVGKAFGAAEWWVEMQYIYIAEEVNIDGKRFLFALANWVKSRGLVSESPHWETAMRAWPEID